MDETAPPADAAATDETEPLPRFRILSQEGGGIMGAFSASALAAFEEDTGPRCVDHFDLIAGTSTGGIIAIGLGMGIPAREICNFYVKHGTEIFPNTGFAGRIRTFLRHLVRPKHSLEVLKQTLSQILCKPDGTPFRFGDSRVRLIVPAYDGLYGRIFVFKTRHVDRLKYDVNAEAVDVALATAAAPTYFTAAKFPEHEASYVDGGVWANCPALIAVAEAVHFLGIDRTKIDVLNIGTTTVPFNTVSKAKSGVLGWNKGLIDLFMTAQVETSAALASLLTEGNLHKINYTACPGRFSLDDASRVSELVGLGRAEAVKVANMDLVKQRFLNGRHRKRAYGDDWRGGSGLTDSER